MRFQDFFNFQKMIAKPAVGFLYWIGLAIIVLFGLASIAGSVNMMSMNPGLGMLQLLVAALAVAFGIFFWRVVCEMYLTFISMNERLEQIRDKLPGA